MLESTSQRNRSWSDNETMSSFLSDQRGTASVEYAVLLVTFSIVVALALYALGPGLVEFFMMQVAWLALPIP